MNEGFSLIIGGTETTARSLSLCFYNLITNEPVRTKLREELRQVMPAPDRQPTWNQLEKLPYLVRAMASSTYDVGDLLIKRYSLESSLKLCVCQPESQVDLHG